MRIGALWVVAFALAVYLAVRAVHFSFVVAAALGLVLGMAARALWRYSRRSVALRPARSTWHALLLWSAAAVLLVVLVGFPLGLFLVASSNNMSFEAPAPEEPASYEAMITVRGNQWTIHELTAVATASQPPAPISGWTSVRRGNHTWYQRTRVEQHPSGRFSPATISSFRLPDEFGRLASSSQVVFDVPRYYVAQSFPTPKSRTDLLASSARERVVIELANLLPGEYDVRLKIPHRFLRNAVGFALLEFSFLSIVRWVVLAMLAIFADQLRKGVLVPVARWLMTKARLRYVPEH